MTSLRLNEYDQQLELSSPPAIEHAPQPMVEENVSEQHEKAETDIFTLARAISYRANARKRFSRATSVI